MSLRALAKQMAAKGREGDTMLVHMTSGEVGGLQALAQASGGSLTINPDTGLPEANFLKSMLPTLIGAGLAMTGVGAPVAAAAGAAAGAATNKENPMGGALMGGMGAFGGAGLAQGVKAAGAAQAGQAANAANAANAATHATNTATAAQVPQAMLTRGAEQSALNSALVNTAPRAAAPVAAAQPTATESFRALGTQTGRDAFMGNVGGGMGLMTKGYMAAAPMAAAREAGGGDDAGVPGFLRPYKYSRGRADFSNDPREDSSEHRYFGGSSMSAGPVTRLAGGGHVQGPGDGMSDSIPAVIDGQHPARIARDEFMIPADVVSGLGNGSSDAGAQRLYEMIERVRRERTGRTSQPKAIDPRKAMPR